MPHALPAAALPDHRRGGVTGAGGGSGARRRLHALAALGPPLLPRQAGHLHRVGLRP